MTELQVEAFGWLVFLWRLTGLFIVAWVLLRLLGARRRNRLADALFPLPPVSVDQRDIDSSVSRLEGVTHVGQSE